MKKDKKITSKFKLLNIESVKYRTLLTKKFENRKTYEPKDPKMIKAFIPGTIRKIEVKIGDKVKKGDLLLILEAMKMKNRMLSPMDGIIKAINVETGKIVPKGHTLIELE